jgi:hypothetical protein
MSISDLARDIKNNTSNFINEQQFLTKTFSWQVGFGAFSYAHSQIDIIYKYILNQEEHHKVKTFKEEYLDMLLKYNIEYDDKYLFDWIEED